MFNKSDGCQLWQPRSGQALGSVTNWFDGSEPPTTWTINRADESGRNWWEFETLEAIVIDPRGQWLIVRIYRMNDYAEGGRVLVIPLGAGRASSTKRWNPRDRLAAGRPRAAPSVTSTSDH